MLEMTNVLIVGAHYDDTELGAGGTAAKLVYEGKNVYKITLTNTEVMSETMNLNIRADRVKDNSRRACEILGIREIEFTPGVYGNLSYSQKMMQDMEQVISQYSIDTLICHYTEDYQTDHVAASQICRTAGRHVRNLLMYQSNPYITPQTYAPNIFVDISDFVEKKKAALACYDSEHDRQGRLFSTNVQRNQIWGYGNHMEYAEGFCAIKFCL